MNNAQKLDEAMIRVEERAASLIERAELLATMERIYEKRVHRALLLQEARSYAAAVRHLARVR